MPGLSKITATLYIILAFLIAFPVAHLRDSDLGTASIEGFIITESTGKTPPGQLKKELSEYAIQHHITIGLEYLDPDYSEKNRHLYVAAGEESSTMSRWLHSGYEGFDPNITVHVSPLSDANLTDAGGQYRVTGSSEQREKLLHHVQNLGFTASVVRINWIFFLSNPITITIVAMLLLIATLTLGGVLLRAREYAIRRTHGQGLWNMIGQDLFDLLPVTTCSFIAVSTISGAALYLYNQFSAVTLYLQGLIALLTIGGFAFILSLTIGVAILQLTPLIPALKGKIPGTPVIATSYALRLCALTIALTIVGSTVSTALEVKRQSLQEEAWRAHSEAEIIRIATRTGDMFTEVAPSLRKADRDGDLIMSSTIQKNSGEPNHILANTLYAKRELSLPDHEAPLPGEALLIIPEGTEEDIVEAACAHIYSEAKYAGTTPPKIREKTIPGDTEIFTYSTSFGYTAADSIISGIPVAVLSRGLEGIADYNLVANATQSTVLAANAAAMQKIIDDPQAHPFIGGHSTAFSQWQQSYTQAQDHVRLHMINLAILVLVVTAYVLGSAAVYQIRNRQRLAVTELMGRSPWRARIGLLAIEAVFLLIPVAWLLHRHHSYEEAALTAMPRNVLRSMAVTPELIAATIGISAMWTLVCLAMSARLGRIYSRTPARSH